MKFEKRKVTNKIHLLVFDSSEELASVFLRFQEYYESPEFRGKVFSLEDFKGWYTKNSPSGMKTGEFKYYSDWNGFNVPSSILESFRDGSFDPLSKEERKFLDMFRDEKEPFYVIGVLKGGDGFDDSMRHEIAHGMFYTNETVSYTHLRAHET